MSLTKECISGVTHDGEPTGRIEKIDGVETYIATPTGEFAKEKALLFLTDIFGVPLVNNKLLADDFAKNGIQVFMPDYFEGDPIPVDAMNTGFNREEWSKKHPPEKVRNLVDKVIGGLKERGVTTLAANGYCFGARYAVDLMQENLVKVGIITHPSRLVPAQDFEKLVKQSKAPLLINSCEIDNAFPAESCQIADDFLGGGKYSPGYKRVHWDGCSHGFAVRGDMSVPKVKEGKEGAFKATVEFLGNL